MFNNNSNLREVWDLEYLLWNAYQKIDRMEREKMPYDLKIIKMPSKEVAIEKQIKDLKELKEILETLKDETIGVELHEVKVLKKENKR